MKIEIKKEQVKVVKLFVHKRKERG